MQTKSYPVSCFSSLCARHKQRKNLDGEGKRYFNMCGYSGLHIYVCVHKCAWCPRKPEENTGSLEEELEVVVSYHMGAGNKTRVLRKSSQCS